MATPILDPPPTVYETDTIQAMTDRLRRDVLVSTNAAGSGHPTSCLSCAELVACLFFHELRFDINRPAEPANDRFVLSKGHAAPILWAALLEAGAMDGEQLDELRRYTSTQEGHPTPRNRWVDVATGSLGQGLSVGYGMAWASRMDQANNQIFVLMGDGETMEGSVWEAAVLASHYQLSNLTAIVDVNRLGQTGETIHGHNLEAYAMKFEAFGWQVRIIDGHDIEEIVEAYRFARSRQDAPTAILAKTEKGKGVSFLEGAPGRHGKPLEGEELDQSLREVEGNGEKLPFIIRPPGPQSGPGQVLNLPAVEQNGLVVDDSDQPTATRQVYGDTLKKLAMAYPNMVALDGEVSNSTYAESFAAAFPGRYIESYIAEQNMVGAAMGLSAMGKLPFVSTFASFLARAFDQIRMAGISRSDIKFVGSHCGVSIGEDGPSQMGLEDIAMFRTVPGSTIFYPCDASPPNTFSVSRQRPMASAMYV